MSPPIGSSAAQNSGRARSGSGHGSPLLSRDLDNLSASLELEDIIDDYDGRSASHVTSSDNNNQLSQSYLTATNGTWDDDASFYSALQDGFSVSQYELARQDSVLNENLWADTDEGSRMLPSSNFQVFWHDLEYKIKPKITLGSVWHNFEQAFKSNLVSTFSCKNRTRTRAGCKTNDPAYDQEPKTIIQNISGSFKSSELTAVMGPSGAGKTSLLNFLARRREEGYTGQLYAQNSERRIKISTIPQNDHLPEYLTVRENLMFASRLKNPSCDHTKNIEKVSSILGLEHCLDTRTKRISGGELKRLAIAQELLSKPDILILDEPTSGLDSLTCYKTISVLKNITQASARKLIDPIAIVLTIHQPQQEVFDIFDKIYVLANGGIVIYNGPPDKCTQFIETHAGVRRPDEDYNPASFLIDIAAGEHGPEPIASLEKQVKLDFSKIRDKTSSQISRLTKKGGMVHSVSLYLDGDSPSVNKINATPTWNGARRRSYLYIDQRIAKGSSMNTGSFWQKTGILSRRYWISILRDPKQMITRITFHILLPITLAIMMGTEPGRVNACPKFSSQYVLKELVNGEGLISTKVLDELLFAIENIAIIFVVIYSLASANIASITLSFTLDMQSSLKEYYNGWYSMPSYIIARFITDIPMTLILPILTTGLTYPLTGQITGPGLSYSYRILITALAIVLGSMVGQIMGMIFGALYIGHVSTALFVSQGALLPLVFLSGFMVRTKNMSSVVYALSQLSFYKHVLEIAIIARYGFNACNCIPSTISGEEVKLVGVSDRLKSFTRYWMSSVAETTDDGGDLLSSNLINSNNSSSLQLNNPAEAESDDIFQLFAKQISLYNTYGIEVRSCEDVKPYQLTEASLNDGDITRGFVALIILVVLMKLLLFLTVKLVIHFRTSL